MKNSQEVKAVPHTYASWGGNDQQFLFQNGNTGRGEYCEMYVNVRLGRAVIFYTNVYSGKFKSIFPDTIGIDLRTLRQIK